MDILSVRLLGVDEPLDIACDDLGEVWDALQDGDWMAVSGGGTTVQLRSSYVACAQGTWEASAAPPALDGIWAWLVGARAPVQLSFGGDWPRPGTALKDGSEWIGWRDAEDRPVMLQVQHLQALLYPTALDAPPKRKKKV